MKHLSKYFVYIGAALAAWYIFFKKPPVSALFNSVDLDSCFNPLFWKRYYSNAWYGGLYPLLPAVADKMCYDIWLCFTVGLFGEDEEALYNLFRQFKNQCEVSYVCERFNAKYKLDLSECLKSGISPIFSLPNEGLNESELSIISGIVFKLPIK